MPEESAGASVSKFTNTVLCKLPIALWPFQLKKILSSTPEFAPEPTDGLDFPRIGLSPLVQYRVIDMHHDDLSND